MTLFPEIQNDCGGSIPFIVTLTVSSITTTRNRVQFKLYRESGFSKNIIVQGNPRLNRNQVIRRTVQVPGAGKLRKLRIHLTRDYKYEELRLAKVGQILKS